MCASKDAQNDEWLQRRHAGENSYSIRPPVLDYRCAGQSKELPRSVKNDAAIVRFLRSGDVDKASWQVKVRRKCTELEAARPADVMQEPVRKERVAQVWLFEFIVAQTPGVWPARGGISSAPRMGMC